MNTPRSRHTLSTGSLDPTRRVLTGHTLTGCEVEEGRGYFFEGQYLSRINCLFALGGSLQINMCFMVPMLLNSEFLSKEAQSIIVKILTSPRPVFEKLRRDTACVMDNCVYKLYRKCQCRPFEQ